MKIFQIALFALLLPAFPLLKAQYFISDSTTSNPLSDAKAELVWQSKIKYSVPTGKLYSKACSREIIFAGFRLKLFFKRGKYFSSNQPVFMSIQLNPFESAPIQ
jgi:hypothetical protein